MQGNFYLFYYQGGCRKWDHFDSAFFIGVCPQFVKQFLSNALLKAKFVREKIYVHY